MSRTATPIRVGIETTPRSSFASALDWPGWCRAGRTEAAALEALDAARERYLPVARAAGGGEPGTAALEVVQSMPGDATTAFGAPAIVFDADREPVSSIDGERSAAILEACWVELARIVAGAPAELRKGPRGGGRDRDAIMEHVGGAHHAYTRPMGLRIAAPSDAAAIAAMRSAMLDVLRAPSDGSPPPGAKWPQRYAARRVAWHALDHAWEIEDRSTP